MDTPTEGTAALTPTENAIEIRGLKKVYGGNGRTGGVLALENFDLAIPQGTLFAMRGPPGPGKRPDADQRPGRTGREDGRAGDGVGL